MVWSVCQHGAPLPSSATDDMVGSSKFGAIYSLEFRTSGMSEWVHVCSKSECECGEYDSSMLSFVSTKLSFVPTRSIPQFKPDISFRFLYA